ncbi:hypothetical protein B0H17DRAFT_1138773 [Mycena rosella]|uniref:Uncharacterized protein n=1 Tax=Mycena rosella TaxID=1033263 RepID=A0AAD7GBZ7_MYCRO|nr:hypothetical protein B0H17DRAFT_1138773 [Mycena rosella]
MPLTAPAARRPPRVIYGGLALGSAQAHRMTDVVLHCATLDHWSGRVYRVANQPPISVAVGVKLKKEPCSLLMAASTARAHHAIKIGWLYQPAHIDVAKNLQKPPTQLPRGSHRLWAMVNPTGKPFKKKRYIMHISPTVRYINASLPESV